MKSHKLPDAEYELWDRLSHEYRNELYSIAYSFVHNHEDAEDIVQDSLLKVSKYLYQVVDKTEQEKFALLKLVCKCCAKDKYRKNKKYYSTYAPLNDIGAQYKDIDYSRIEAGESPLAIAFPMLSENYQEALLFHAYGYKTKEIKDMMSVALSTAHAWVRNGKKELNRLMKMIENGQQPQPSRRKRNEK